MTNGLTSPKATDRPPGPTPQAARGAPPPSDAFAGMLDAHQARTAIAEGHSPEKHAADATRRHMADAARKHTDDVAQKPAREDKPAKQPDAVTPAEGPKAEDAAPKPEDAATLAATVAAALGPVATAPATEPTAAVATPVAGVPTTEVPTPTTP